MSSALEAPLRQGLAELGLALSDAQVAQLLAYLDLLGKWNRVYNLTAVREPVQMLGQHLLDCLAVIGPLRQRVPGPARLLDVGAGGGLPAVVIAIACPDIAVTAVDTVAKKAAFVQQVALALGLPNLRGEHARVESLHTSYDVVTSRAFAALADFTAWSRQALAPHGLWMALKGKLPQDEIQALPASVRVEAVEPLTVPGLEAQRCIVWMRHA